MDRAHEGGGGGTVMMPIGVFGTLAGRGRTGAGGVGGLGAFAGGAWGSLLLDRAFAGASGILMTNGAIGCLASGFLPSEAGRLVSIFVASGVGSIFGADTALFFIIVAILAISGLTTLVALPALVLIPGPLPPGGCGGGGGCMPAGTGSGPDGGFIKCITIGSGGTLDWDLPLVRAYIGTLIGVFLVVFPPPIIIGCDAPPGGGGGGCPSFETSIRTWSAVRCPLGPNSASRATYDWSAPAACGPRWLAI